MKFRAVFFRSVIGTALLFAGVHLALATTRTVTNLNDSGAGSLRDTIAASVDGDSIDFSVAGLITLTSGELRIASSITINGPGANVLTVSGTNASRVFNISNGSSSGPHVTIDGLTVDSGNGNFNINGGGGIYNDHATLTVSNATLSNNKASRGGGIYNDGSGGGNASATLNNCTLSRVTPVGTHNLITGYTFCPGVVTNVDPQLGPLQPASVNGGKTPTMAIPLYSSAMGVADPGTSLPYDQRFADRPQPDKAPRNGYDIGAMQVCRRFIGPSLGYGPCGETHITPPPTTTLTITAAGAGTTDRAPGTYNVPVDSVIPIMATPDWGYAFWHWTTNVADHTNPSTTVIMNQAQSVTAAFVTLRLTNVSTTNSHLTVTFQASGDSRGDYVYRLERSPSLSPPNWQSIPGVNNIQPARPGTYSMTDTTNSINSGQAFYRVRVLP